MPKTFDAIIIGGGIAGCGVANGLARRGWQVLVLDRSRGGGEASPHAAGILDPFLELNSQGPLLKLSLEAFRRYPAFVRELKRETGCDVGYERIGMTYVAMNASEERKLKQRYLWQKRLPVPVKWIARDRLIRMHPSLSPDVRSGMLLPTIGKVNPRKLMAAFGHLLKKRGVTIERLSGAVSPVIKNSHVVGVRAGTRAFCGKVVINAAGCWSQASAPLRMRIPVRPVRGQLILLKGRERVSTILHTLLGSYLVPWEAGRSLVGSTVEFVGYRSRVTARGRRSILTSISKVVPAVTRWKTEDSWAGLRPFPSDRRPIIGPTAVRGYYLATGYYRSGILIASHIGELLAEAIISEKWPKILLPFSPNRFRRNRK
ncbi:MAG: glycine oxidase ThiO [Candidatus Omnitrophota bacterium]|nr:glycine oxidase ThiO [Candidatus Omnitrophota bacterium]